jgi:hypothetical protein
LLLLPHSVSGEANSETAPTTLLDLPDTCLVAVLQCCAAHDQRSLFNAARAHVRLHQAAVLTLRSVNTEVPNQQQLDSVLLYLRPVAKHGQHIDSISIGDVGGRDSVVLQQLPPTLRLSSLQLSRLTLQLQPGNGFQGVLGAAAGVAALKKLTINKECKLLDGQKGSMAAALSLLPAGLEHLRLNVGYQSLKEPRAKVPANALQHLQKLTYLELDDLYVLGTDPTKPGLQTLQFLTCLVHLELSPPWTGEANVDWCLAASMLSGACHLTHLGLMACSIESGALAGKTQLQRLSLSSSMPSGSARGVAQLLLHLQSLQQHTYLLLDSSLPEVGAEDGTPLAAAAYASLTASSKLQHLDISRCDLPEGVWQHVFPAGRQLPNLQYLNISEIYRTPPPEGSRLASCCLGLQSLCIRGVDDVCCSTEHVAGLQRLTGLVRLIVFSGGPQASEVLQAVCKLTGFKALVLVHEESGFETFPLQLTQLRQLTELLFDDDSAVQQVVCSFSCHVSSAVMCLYAFPVCCD